MSMCAVRTIGTFCNRHFILKQKACSVWQFFYLVSISFNTSSQEFCFVCWVIWNIFSRMHRHCRCSPDNYWFRFRCIPKHCFFPFGRSASTTLEHGKPGNGPFIISTNVLPTSSVPIRNSSRTKTPYNIQKRYFCHGSFSLTRVSKERSLRSLHYDPRCATSSVETTLYYVKVSLHPWRSITRFI